MFASPGGVIVRVSRNERSVPRLAPGRTGAWRAWHRIGTKQWRFVGVVAGQKGVAIRRENESVAVGISTSANKSVADINALPLPWVDVQFADIRNQRVVPGDVGNGGCRRLWGKLLRRGVLLCGTLRMFRVASCGRRWGRLWKCS